jgi:hypothetical protein
MVHKDIYSLKFDLEKDETLHYRKKYINKVFYSLFDDEEILSEKRKKILGSELAQYYSDPIEYRYNNLGFRENKDVKSQNIGCLALGDSFTEGEGVKHSDLWTSVLETKLKMPVYNFGICGTGPDSWFKILVKYIQSFQGDYIFLLSTYFPRYMFPGENRFIKGVNRIFKDSIEVYSLTRSKNFILYNYQIKMLAMEALANHYGKKLAVVNVHDLLEIPINSYNFNITFEKYEPARDCKHLGRDFQDKVANRFLKLIK